MIWEKTKTASLSSSPCFAHELTPDGDGGFAAVDEQQRLDVMRWRKAERQRLIEARLAASADTRKQWADEIARTIVASHDLKNRLVSFYWPFRGEPDLRELMKTVIEQGGHCALPVVVEKAQPLEFWRWSPGQPLDKGVWNIPIPAKRDVVVPDIVLSPVVGFDGGNYRLGYGGGYFDRTLAALDARPLVIGVGYTMARIKTIFPQPHDIAMSVIITEAGVEKTGS